MRSYSSRIGDRRSITQWFRRVISKDSPLVACRASQFIRWQHDIQFAEFVGLQLTKSLRDGDEADAFFARYQIFRQRLELVDIILPRKRSRAQWMCVGHSDFVNE